MQGTGETGPGGMEVRTSGALAPWMATSEHPDGGDGEEGQALFHAVLCQYRRHTVRRWHHPTA